MQIDHYLTFENLQENKSSFQHIVKTNYGLSIAGYIIIYILVTGFSLPGATILTLGSGFLFGVILGAIYVNIGATTGATMAFLFSRYIAGDWVQKKYGDKLINFNNELEKNGYRYLLTLRLIPVFPFFLINIFAGLTKISLRTFIWTTSMGILPGSLVYTYAGSQLNFIKSTKDIFTTRIVMVFLLLALFILLPVIISRIKEKRRYTNV
jgi:uncharacterized membrane protein YdjX (TVP38/TMEM64 family)